MTSRRSLRTATFALAAALAVAACGGADSADDGAPVVTASSPDPTIEAADGAAAPAPTDDAPEILRFTGPLVGGGELEAAGLAGKPTAFWFWAPT